jgi:hypothetical protein
MVANTTNPQAGINFAAAYSAATTTSSTTGLDQPSPPWLPGTIEFGSDGTKWMFCKAGGSITANDFALITTVSTSVAEAITSTLGRANFGARCGVAGATVTANQFFWMCVEGYLAAANILTGSVANVALHTTGTAGRLDDTAGAGSTATVGPVIGLATSASNTSAVFLLNPTVTVLDA